MNTIQKISVSVVALTGGIFLTGCGSVEEAKTSNGSTSLGPISITAINAENLVESSSVTSSALLSVVGSDNGAAASTTQVLGVEVAPTMGLSEALALVNPYKEKVKASANSGVDLVYGVDLIGSGTCSVSGSYAGSGTGDATSNSGSVTVTDCDEGNGVSINGVFSWASTYNDLAGDYAATAQGSISVTSTTNSQIKFTFSGIDYDEIGNVIAGTYTIRKASFSIDLSVASGFSVELTAPIVEGEGGFSSCPESGTILVSGANGTTAEGIYNGDGTMRIKANGEIVNASVQCYF